VAARSPAALLALQRSAGNRAVGRVLAREETTTTVTVARGGCSLAQHREIEPAVRTATGWLRQSIRRLGAYVGDPAAEANAPTRTALRRHFASTSVSDATYVRDRFVTIVDDMLNSRDLRVECHTNSDTTCPAANAYVRGNLFVFCPIFFRFQPLQQAMSVIHEMAHAIHDTPHITDRAYRDNRYYRFMTPAEARTNAESYGLLAQELGTGRALESTAPRDTVEDCPDDWRRALAKSAAVAERWNRNAQTKTRNRRATSLADWTDLQTQHLGGTTTAALDAAQRVYDAAEDAFDSDIDFECEPGATGGRCRRSVMYWYASGDLHVCPSWRALPNEDDRTELLLSSFYGYKDIEGDGRRRANLAALARALSTRFWPAPSP
jgi:hypothetical protein